MLNHLKVSTKGDGSDPSLVQPSDWNADHVFTGDVTLPGNLYIGGNFGIRHDQNDNTFGRVMNLDTGNAAKAQWEVSTGGAVAYFGICSINFTPSGLLFPGAAYLVSSANLLIDVTTAGNIIFGTGDVERLRLDSKGDLGLGVIPPAAAAGFKSIFLGTTGSIAGSNTNSLSFATNSYWNGAGNVNMTTNTSGVMYMGGDGATWFFAPSAAAGAATPYVERMNLNNGGNLGLGRRAEAWWNQTTAIAIGASGSFFASSPVAAIPSIGMDSNSYYNGANHISIYAGWALQFDLSQSGAFSWYRSDVQVAAGAVINFTRVMFLDSAGGLRLGGATTNILMANEFLSVYGRMAALDYVCGNDEVNQGAYKIGSTGSFIGRDNNTGRAMLYSAQSSLACACVSAGVYLVPGGNTWNAVSSRSIKRDIQPIPGDVFDIIAGHEAALFRYDFDPDDRLLRPGLFFEDAQRLFPYAADHEPEHTTIDTEGVEHLVPERMGLSLELYIPLLMAAMKLVDIRLKSGGL